MLVVVRVSVALVLVVDNEFSVVEVLESILEDAGHEVITESNGQQALRRANKRRPDLVLLDFMMPIMGGSAVLEAMREDPALCNIPVVIRSSLPESTISDGNASFRPVDRSLFASLHRHAEPVCPRHPWHTPWMERVLPVVIRIAQRHPARTIFTRFVPPDRPDQMAGSWRRYYEHWRNLTLERLDSELIELVPALAALCPPVTVIYKSVYSASSRSLLPKLLRRRGIDSLIITGAETDVCVLAPALDAVDLGYRTVIARDTLCSSSDAAHDALLTLYHDRFSQQIEAAHSETILAASL